MTEKNIATYSIILFTAWLIFSGLSDFTITTLGVLSVILVLFISRKVFQISKFDLFEQINFTRFLMFLPYQLLEIVKSNLHVALVIIKSKVNPQLIVIKNTTQTEIGEYILALSITLTPGSLIVEYNKEELLIHVLDSFSKKSITTLNLNRAVEHIEFSKEHNE